MTSGSQVRKRESGRVPAASPTEADGAELLIQRMDLMTHLYAQVEHLSDDLKQSFLLVAIEGCSYQEAAQLLSIPISTVHSHLFRARQAIKARLLPVPHNTLRI
jgi:RNA polymerase sigma-70 factor (ECF subfamily)